MGHASIDREGTYKRLQERLDSTVTGAPYSPAFMKILELLYTPQQAELARRLPTRPKEVLALSRDLNIPVDELEDRLSEMAARGLALDLSRGRRRYFALAPMVVGFFEFTYMRAPEDLDLKRLSVLFEEYMTSDDRFARSVFRGRTQIGRSIVREEALPEEPETGILDWERATHIVGTATHVGVGQCACRHHTSHLGKACDREQYNCMTLNYAAQALFRSGHAKQVTNEEGLRILQEAKEAGLCQTADNVQRKVSFICNCCGCCCGMVYAIKKFDLRGAITTSNWIMESDPAKCTGCGECAEACPVDAIEIIRLRGAAAGLKPGSRRKSRKLSRLDESLCLGCGVCHSACKFGAISMRARPARVLTPETMFDRMVAMAIERGKLADLLFDDPGSFSHRALGRIVTLVENSPPFKVAMAIEPLRSVFLNALVKGAKATAGAMGRMMS